MKPQYTVSRCRKGTTYSSAELYGKVHGCNSYEMIQTLCGTDMRSRYWYVITNNRDGEVTCPKCLKVMKKEDT